MLRQGDPARTRVATLRVHFARNITQKLGSARSKPVNALITTIFAQTTPEALLAQYHAVTDSRRGSFPEIADMLWAAEAT
ncbi:hypothetical protein GCM10022240_26440 [Microbacterium kribbense]|uniref:Uncharacterized protein n=1 Tax=Microbacterium kribbense TaxID=433645 RepID=A0ABP7GSH7_9MICO